MFKKIECADTGEVVYNYKSYLQTRHWQMKRIRIAKYRNYTCEICGRNCRENNIKANIHHKTYVRIGNELNKDLYYLCEQCHHEIHEFKITFNLSKYKQIPKKKHKKKREQVKGRKVSCKTCSHFIYKYNPKSKKYGYCCEVSNKFAKTYNDVVNCNIYTKRK